MTFSYGVHECRARFVNRHNLHNVLHNLQISDPNPDLNPYLILILTPAKLGRAFYKFHILTHISLTLVN